MKDGNLTRSKVQKEGMCVAVCAAGHQSRKQEKGMKPGRAETTLQKQPKGKALDMKKKYPTGKVCKVQGRHKRKEKEN